MFSDDVSQPIQSRLSTGKAMRMRWEFTTAQATVKLSVKVTVFVTTVLRGNPQDATVFALYLAHFVRD